MDTKDGVIEQKSEFVSTESKTGLDVGFHRQLTGSSIYCYETASRPLYL